MSVWSKIYSRIKWENKPSANSPINESNLNKMDYALDKLDDRVVELSGYHERAATSAANAQNYATQAYNSSISASASASAAKVSEENTKSYMERAFSATPEGYDALVDNVNMLDIQTATDATLYGSKSGGLRVNHMVGNTEQRTLSGKNRLNYDVWKNNTPVNGTAVYENNGVTITATADDAYTGFSSEYAKVEVSEGDTVIMSWEEETNTPGRVFLFPNGNVTASEYVVVSNDAAKKISYTVPSGITFITFRFGVATSGNTIAYKNIMIRINDDDPTFEPFCGAQPSPNPEYPQSIHNTGDCVEMIQGRWNGETGAYTTSTTSICTKNSIQCKSGDKVKVVLEKPLTLQCVYSTDSGHLSHKGVETVSEYEFTVPSNATKFKFNVINADGLTPQTVGKIQLTINGKYVVQIVEHGKNIFGGLALAQALVASGSTNVVLDTDAKTVTFGHNKNYETKFILFKGNFKENTQYSFVLNGTHTNAGAARDYYSTNLGWLYTDGTRSPSINLNNTGSLSEVVKSDVNKSVEGLIYIWAEANDTLTLNYEQCGIFEGVITEADFEPYTESTATILLDEPLRDEDLIVNVDGVWQVERNVEEVVIDGNQVYRLLIDNSDEHETISFGVNDTISKYLYTPYLKCDKLPLGTIWYKDNEAFNYEGSLTDTGLRMRLKKSRLNSADLVGIKAYLAENPLTFELTLKTPTIETLAHQSQIALNSLKTFDTVTHITVDSVTQPAELEVEFGKSKVGAYTLKSLNDNDIDRIERAEMKAQLNELATALVAVGSEV